MKISFKSLPTDYGIKNIITLKTKIEANTNGKGLWNNVIKNTKIYKIVVEKYEDEDFCLIFAYFTKASWNTNKHGLIYTDNLWLKEFKKELMKLGVSKYAVNSIGYTEQGMQENNYVSLDSTKTLFNALLKMKNEK